MYNFHEKSMNLIRISILRIRLLVTGGVEPGIVPALVYPVSSHAELQTLTGRPQQADGQTSEVALHFRYQPPKA